MLIVCGSRDAGLTDRIHVSRRIAPAGRAGMATAALRHDPAHPRHLLRGAPAREYRRYQHQAAGRRGRRTRQDRRSLMCAVTARASTARSSIWKTSRPGARSTSQQGAERRQAMSYSISTLLTRNLHDVFGENDPARRRAAIDEIFTEDGVFYDPSKGVYRGRDEIDRVAGAIRATHPDFRYQPIAGPEELGNGGRIPWGSGRPGEGPAYAGADFIILPGGRVAGPYLFFFRRPPAGPCCLSSYRAGLGIIPSPTSARPPPVPWP